MLRVAGLRVTGNAEQHMRMVGEGNPASLGLLLGYRRAGTLGICDAEIHDSINRGLEDMTYSVHTIGISPPPEPHRFVGLSRGSRLMHRYNFAAVQDVGVRVIGRPRSPSGVVSL